MLARVEQNAVGFWDSRIAAPDIFLSQLPPHLAAKVQALLATGMFQLDVYNHTFTSSSIKNSTNHDLRGRVGRKYIKRLIPSYIDILRLAGIDEIGMDCLYEGLLPINSSGLHYPIVHHHIRPIEAFRGDFPDDESKHRYNSSANIIITDSNTHQTISELLDAQRPPKNILQEAGSISRTIVSLVPVGYPDTHAPLAIAHPVQATAIRLQDAMPYMKNRVRELLAVISFLQKGTDSIVDAQRAIITIQRRLAIAQAGLSCANALIESAPTPVEGARVTLQELQAKFVDVAATATALLKKPASEFVIIQQSVKDSGLAELNNEPGTLSLSCNDSMCDRATSPPCAETQPEAATSEPVTSDTPVPEAEPSIDSLKAKLKRSTLAEAQRYVDRGHFQFHVFSYHFKRTRHPLMDAARRSFGGGSRKAALRRITPDYVDTLRVMNIDAVGIACIAEGYTPINFSGDEYDLSLHHIREMAGHPELIRKPEGGFECNAPDNIVLVDGKTHMFINHMLDEQRPDKAELEEKGVVNKWVLALVPKGYPHHHAPLSLLRKATTKKRHPIRAMLTANKMTNKLDKTLTRLSQGTDSAEVRDKLIERAKRRLLITRAAWASANNMIEKGKDVDDRLRLLHTLARERFFELEDMARNLQKLGVDVIDTPPSFRQTGTPLRILNSQIRLIT